MLDREPDARRADVDEIQRAAERAPALTRQLLAFSRKQILAVRVLHVGDIVGDVTPMLRRLIGETIDLRTAVGNRGLVKADPGQLEQVIVNLAVNARDAMPTAAGSRSRRRTSCSTRRSPGFTVGPSGPARHARRQRYRARHGRRDAEADLRAVLHDQAGRPRHGPRPRDGLRHREAERRHDLGRERGRAAARRSSVYLPQTDDVESARLVHAVANPLKALDYAQAHRAPIDLVFSDVILPNMSGRAMVTQITAMASRNPRCCSCRATPTTPSCTTACSMPARRSCRSRSRPTR